MVRTVAALISASLAWSCVHVPQRPDPAAVERAIDRVAQQVRGCYRSPRVPHAARQIVTRLHVRYGLDGRPIGLPAVVWQASVTTANRPYARAMAEAAVSAVLRCGPMRLPQELHAGGWDEFDLTFSPSGIA